MYGKDSTPKPWAPPGWQIRYFYEGRVVYSLRETYYESAFAHFKAHTGAEDNSDTREQVLMGLAQGLYWVEASGTA